MKNAWRKLDGSYAKMVHAIFDNFWKQHTAKQLLNGHLHPIS